MPLCTAIAGPGAGPDLTDWPLLVWLPDDGVCTEDCGCQAVRIGSAAAEQPDRTQLARRFGTSAEHIRQALSYLAARGQGHQDPNDR